MRTTLTLEKDLALTLREEARRTGRPLKRIVNETLRAGLVARKQGASRRYRLTPSHLGGVVPGVDLDKALRLAEAAEDEAIARKLELRAAVCSTDADFERFPGVERVNPLRP